MEKDETQTGSMREETDTRRFSRVRALRRLWRAEVFYLTGLVLFAVLAVAAYTYAHFQWDVAVQQAVRRISVPGFGPFMRIVSIPGNDWNGHIIGVVTALILLLAKFRAEAAALLLATGGSAVGNNLLKMIVARPRPAPEPGMLVTAHSGNSFPSGHVTFYICYFGFLLFVAHTLLPRQSALRTPVLFLLGLPVLLVGPSRVYLLAHYPSDVVGSYLFGGLWLALTVEIYRRWKQTAVGSSPANRPAT